VKSENFYKIMKEHAEVLELEFKRNTAYHFHLKGVFLINIYPTTDSYYIQGTNHKYKFSSLDELCLLALGEINCPTSPEGSKRKSLRYMKQKKFNQSNICFFCGTEISSVDVATVEHKIPLSRGGSNRSDNISLSHDECNQKRKNNLKVERIED